jgi:hypothetical protein
MKQWEVAMATAVQNFVSPYFVAYPLSHGGEWHEQAEEEKVNLALLIFGYAVMFICSAIKVCADSIRPQQVCLFDVLLLP